jgi:hypothetical protein
MSTSVPAPGALVSTSALRWRSLRTRREHLLVLAVLVAAGLAHGLNMLHFPYLEDDEGTYMSQAWAVIHLGQLAAYTYWYDHAPLGWIQISGWLLLTGGNHSFGSAIASGRVLMLVLQLISTFLVYSIARTVSGKPWVGALAAAAFALSSYGIYYHRRVLLDNVTTVWLLAALLALLGRRPGLRRVWLSAIALAISILSKEITVVSMPALALLVASRTDRSTRWFAVTSWLSLVLSIVSLYPLMAIIKNELFPSHTLLGGTNPHVSLLCTLQFQGSRGRDGGLLDLHSGFWLTATTWSQDDPLLVLGGTAAAIGCLFAWRYNREAALLGVSVLSLWAFLGRGGEIISFYLVPLLPLLAICLALMAWIAAEALTRVCPTPLRRLVVNTVAVALVAACVSGMALGYGRSGLGLGADHVGLWTSRQADAQLQAEVWVRSHLRATSRMVVDEYMWVDLQAPESGEPRYTAAHYYWKAADDPAINRGVFKGDWRNVDYVVTTPQLVYDTTHAYLPLVQEALQHSRRLVSFDSGGWTVEVRKVDPNLTAASVDGPASTTPSTSSHSEGGVGATCMNSQ